MTSVAAHAQATGPETLDVAGGTRKISGITHEYAIGQVMAGDTYLSGLLVVTPGVLQPAAPIRNTDGQIGSSELQIFPDPMESTLFLLPAFKQGGTLKYTLYDAAGKMIAKREALLKLGTERQDLTVGHIAAGQYLLMVTWVSERTTPKISGYKIQKLP